MSINNYNKLLQKNFFCYEVYLLHNLESKVFEVPVIMDNRLLATNTGCYINLHI